MVERIVYPSVETIGEYFYMRMSSEWLKNGTLSNFWIGFNELRGVSRRTALRRPFINDLMTFLRQRTTGFKIGCTHDVIYLHPFPTYNHSFLIVERSIEEICDLIMNRLADPISPPLMRHMVFAPDLRSIARRRILHPELQAQIIARMTALLPHCTTGFDGRGDLSITPKPALRPLH